MVFGLKIKKKNPYMNHHDLKTSQIYLAICTIFRIFALNMEIVYLLIGVVVGAAFGVLFMLNRKKAVQSTLMLTAQRLTQEEEARKGLQQQLDASADDVRVLNDELTDMKVALASKQTQLLAEQDQNSREMALRQEQFKQQLATVQEQFANLASKLLDQTSSQLKSQNTESMKTLTDPLRENIDQLQRAIQQTNSETAKQTASLSQQLKEMSEQTNRINTTATRLTNVIRGGNKAQGNWGERMLTEILDGQGFREGIDYDTQQVITTTDGGKRLVPDVVLHYPQNEDVVIDSKMSIEAYYLYVNTEDAQQKQRYAQELVRSVRSQMSNLAQKDYSSFVQPPRHAIDFVIMFVPNEGALQLALQTEPRLWGEAFDKQVFLTSQQNLMAILKMIQIAWRQYAQTENQKRVFGMAEELLKRVGEFIKRFEKVGKDLETLHYDYEEAYKKAFTGRQSIVQKANQLKELGVKETATLPIPPTEADIEEKEIEQE